MDNNLQKNNETKKIYSYSEVFNSSLEYFNGDEQSANNWIDKYALKDADGNLYELNPSDMHRRLAKEIHRIEKKYANPMSESEILELLKNFKYIVPQGGPMAGIGNDMQIVSLSNCFVIGNEESDSYGGIFKIDQEQAQLMKRRGGVGHDLSYLRPKGSVVKNSALTSTGIVPFMERYSNTTREVAQDGRRGALMLSISVEHPDSEDFIDAKLTEGKITCANVSVKITDEFMKAVQNKKNFVQKYPINSVKPKFTKEINPQHIWKKIIHNAWKAAEPGILFWDTITRESIPDCYSDFGYKTVSTNPCGEIPLCPYDSCRLLALNLYSYVDNSFTAKAKFQFDLFKQHVAYAQRIMDDIIDLELEKIDAILAKIKSDPENEEVKRTETKLWENIRHKAEEGRRTGVGITSEGDMLAALNLRYGSVEAIEFAVKVQKTLAIEAYRSSVTLARERGAFKIYDPKREENNPFIQRLRDADPNLAAEMEKFGRRNISLLTIAPTGTVSQMTQTTSGIEPVFKVSYRRRKKINPNDKNQKVDYVDNQGDKWTEYDVLHHKFIDWLKVNGYSASDYINASKEEKNGIFEKSPYYKSTSADIDYLGKVKMQGAIQKWVDHSISVTINMPKDVTEEIVEQCFWEAWKSGCKGITVYRDSSRDGVLIECEDIKESAKKAENEIQSKRPQSLEADVIRFKNNKEDWIAFVGLLNNKPYEIFTGRIEEDVLCIPENIKKGHIVKIRNSNGASRYDFKYINKYEDENVIGGLSNQFDREFWNYAKIISANLRYGMSLVNIVNMISGLSFSDESINTWKNGVRRILEKYIKNGTDAKVRCTSCGSENSIIYQDGCRICKDCGYSRC